MRIVAVVPAYNARARLGDVLAAVARQVARVVVVDNGSADGTAEWLPIAFPDCVLIANEANRGFAGAVNQGIERALALGAEAVLLVNDDTFFTPGAVDALAAVLAADPRIGSASAHMCYRDRPGVLNGAGGLYDPLRARAALRGCGELDDGRYGEKPAVDYASGAASLYSTRALAAVGSFDEAYFLYFEDVDWGLRARAAGLGCCYVPGARVLHGGSTGTRLDPARRRYYNVRNRLRFAARHAPRRGRCWAWAATGCLLAKQPLRWLSARRRRDAEAVFVAVGDHLRGQYGRSRRFG